MKEKNIKMLKKAIGEMPVFKLKDINFWDIFDNQQDKKENTEYGSLISDLPKKVAPEGLWEKVAYELDNQSDNRHISSFNFLMQVAATFVIIFSIGFGIFFIKHHHPIRSSNKSVMLRKTDINSKNETGNISIWNPALCKSNPRICNTVLFKALDKQLNDVKGELRLMGPIIRKGDPQMMKYYYRLVNLKVEIEKKMVKIIMES